MAVSGKKADFPADVFKMPRLTGREQAIELIEKSYLRETSFEPELHTEEDVEDLNYLRQRDGEEINVLSTLRLWLDYLRQIESGKVFESREILNYVSHRISSRQADVSEQLFIALHRFGTDGSVASTDEIADTSAFLRKPWSFTKRELSSRLLHQK